MIRNLKAKEISIRVLIPFIVLSMIVGAFNIGTSEASTSWKYSYRTESFFRAAIYVYWMNNSNLKEVDCQPNDVKFIYYDFGKDESRTIATAGLYGAYKDFKGKYDNVSKKDNEFYYCTIQVNSHRHRESRKNACITMIHEYGHLLGRDHSKNPYSPMFASYEGISVNKQIALQNRNIKHRLAKSICPGPNWNKK